ncbi:MAG: hypothetical protein ACI9AR_000536 [Flavobacteriaceae bacterium]|jgi:hypothetical protein
MSSIAVLGLVFDIFGAFWLSQSFMIRTNKKMEEETSIGYNGNPYFFALARESRSAGRVGFVLLVAGFVLQGLGQVNVKLNISLCGLIVFFVCLLIFSVVFWNTKEGQKKKDIESHKNINKHE